MPMRDRCSAPLPAFAAALLCATGILGTLPTARADDASTVKLQQDVLELQRIVQQQQRRIENLEGQQSPSRPATLPPTGPKSIDARDGWLNMANWERVRPGMPELEVIRILGVPSALRNAPDGSHFTLLYALEIGTGGFLTGSVSVAAHRVVEVQPPAFR